MIINPRVKFCEAAKSGFNNCCNFSGRARRSEYWYFFLFINLISLFLFSFTMMFLILCVTEDSKEALDGLLVMSYICGVYGLIVMIPFLAIAVRRLHDTGRSGYYFFISFIPLYGMVAIIVYLCLDSKQKDNEFGPSTKYIYSDFVNNPSEELVNKDTVNV